ncbi:uncharacterized protein LOC124944956 [Impatiens glandulifera]|uniref:uncharacterized protein LOC124944956 n=1 Tax=Impatiens glandulifera TaxID=253017 RepID=UPI001FB05094|nr:uncharacterized protein LOC124944956 [Impatiens glandulifera]
MFTPLNLGNSTFVSLVGGTYGLSIGAPIREVYASSSERSPLSLVVKTDDGEVIDCVDIYKQPAFDHPLINDLQMSPTSYPNGMKEESRSDIKLFQDWQKYGECSEGTIPITRITSPSNHTKYPSPFINQDQSSLIRRSPTNGHEYAMISDEGTNYYGASAWLNVWSPNVEYGELSAGKMKLISATLTDFYNSYNSIEVGWMVYPSRYNNSTKPKFYGYWTSDGDQRTGCYDLDCNGFVQTNGDVAFGATIEPVSTYNGDQYEMFFTIFKDKITGNWWLQFNGNNIGYWPNTLFKRLANNATIVNWGGEILNVRHAGHHTTTQMGSGHFSSESYRKAAYISRMKVFNSNYDRKDPGYLVKIQSNQGCYDVNIDQRIAGKGISYGGPGFSSTCS